MRNRRRVRPSFRRARIAGTAVAVLAAGLTVVPAQPAMARTELISESFAGGSTKPGAWEAPSPKGSHTPCLTAATSPPPGSLKACNAVQSGKEKPDPVGQGVFQLTDHSKQDAGALVLNNPVDTKRGLLVDFDMYMYNTSTPKAADGISFYLLDGAEDEETTGEPGGSLGYTNVKGAVIGFGFDQFGNFSTSKAGPADRSEFIPNNIGIRGAQSTKYRYITGVRSPGPLDEPKAKTRAKAKRHVTVALSQSNFLSLSVDYGDGKGAQKVISDLDLDGIKGQPKLPPTLKLGWAASTGNSTSYHEISGFRAATLNPNLSVKVSGQTTVAPGGKGSAEVVVSNAEAASSTNGIVTATYKVPAGLTPVSAAGPGWACRVAGDTVTCTRPDVLKPGASAPPITIDYKAGPAAAGKLKGIATVATPGAPKDDDDTADHIINVIAATAKGPNLSLEVSGDATLAPGQNGSATLVVSNESPAGPTTGPVTATYRVPAGLTPVSAAGPGWACRVAGDTVTCTRPDVLKSGASAPPITIRYKAGPTAAGKLTSTATANTPGNAVPEGVTGRIGLTITGSPDKPPSTGPADRPPSLGVTVSHDGSPTAGGRTPYHVVITNRADAGPTTTTVTARFTAPPGSTIKSADGDGWACEVAGREVTCTRPGAGPVALKPGKSYPPVNAEVSYPANAAGTKVTAKAGVGTPGDAAPQDNTAQDTATVAKPQKGVTTGLKVKVDAMPDAYKAGQRFTYTVTVTNDGPEAAKGTVLNIDLPEKWANVPWGCKATGGSTCPRPVVAEGGYCCR